MEDSKYDVTMKLYAKKLDKKDFFGKVRYNNSGCMFCLVKWLYVFWE